MKRKLIMQMRNEWRSNVWMMIELFVVGLVLWMVFTVLNGLTALHQEPIQADYTDVYVGTFGTINRYDDEHGYEKDVEMLLTKLRSNPYVEIVGTGSNALPYNFNYSGMALRTEIDGKTEIYNGNWRRMSPETVKAIRLKGLNGETSDELAEIVRRGDLIIGTTEVSHTDTDPLRWRGKQVMHAYDSTKMWTIAAIINGIRRSDYEPSDGTVIVNDTWHNDLIVRVKEGQGRQFLSSLKDTDLEFGNLYVSNLQSVDNIKEDAHKDIKVTYRNVIVCAIFVLVSVFLGFLGSFWYRTQQRVPELALRKVNGATNSDLLRRFISEGLLLLVMPSLLLVPAGLVIIQIINDATESEGGSTFSMDFQGLPLGQWIIWAGLAMSVASLAIMIVAGIWMPARKAMKVEPAIALKDQ